ncbi:MAG: sugar phosphate isomerase/epimerase [Anaerolineae bacterium]|nr:sugar phosphate isomerase/epimerase [Anaerolineae bacterium]
MARPVTLFTGQWADLPFEVVCEKAKSFGYDGLEIACWGDHFDVNAALENDQYTKQKWDTLNRWGLKCFAISNHLVGQAVSDRIDERHKSILPPHVWGDGLEAGVQKRAAEEMKNTARAAAKFGVKVVPGFTGSPIWSLLYSFPPVSPAMIDDGYSTFAQQWNPILDVFDEVGVKFALEVHPTEIAFDIASAQRTLDAVNWREAFGFNFDPSHMGYQGVDYVKFITKFAERIYHVHMKDVGWSSVPTEAGVFGGHLEFGDRRRFWDFRSLGHGKIDFEEIIRALNSINYQGPLSVEWEDGGMDREFGATEACAYVKKIDFPASMIAFDAAFEKKD